MLPQVRTTRDRAPSAISNEKGNYTTLSCKPKGRETIIFIYSLNLARMRHNFFFYMWAAYTHIYVHGPKILKILKPRDHCHPGVEITSATSLLEQ